jgi:hypothetical protein
MNKLAFVAILLLAGACSDGADDAAKQKAAASAAAKKLQLTPGQWTTTAEVIKFTKQDKAPKAAIDTPVGTKSTASACLTEADVKQPPALLLAGSEAYSCTYGDTYLSSGSLNASLTCTRKGVKGEVRMSLDGTYTADTLEANQSASTFLAGEGDANIVSKITARRTGECTASAGKPA